MKSLTRQLPRIASSSRFAGFTVWSFILVNILWNVVVLFFGNNNPFPFPVTVLTKLIRLFIFHAKLSFSTDRSAFISKKASEHSKMNNAWIIRSVKLDSVYFWLIQEQVMYDNASNKPSKWEGGAARVALNRSTSVKSFEQKRENQRFF